MPEAVNPAIQRGYPDDYFARLQRKGRKTQCFSEVGFVGIESRSYTEYSRQTLDRGEWQALTATQAMILLRVIAKTVG